MPELTGSEKQINWAKQIREDAIGTVNSNIEFARKQMDKVSESAKSVYSERIDAYKEVGRQLNETLGKITNASIIINNREMYSGSRINQLAQKWEEMQRKKKN